MDTDQLTAEPTHITEPIHASLPWDYSELDHRHPLMHTCRKCGAPIDAHATVCPAHKDWWIQIVKKSRAQTRRLVEIATERTAANV